MTDDVATLAYAAGLFDGEGTVGIKGPMPSAPRAHRLRCAVNMTDEAAVQFLADTFGGSCRRQLAPSAVVLGRRPKWVWEVNCARAEAFLRAVRPWLRTKAAAADVALELQARMTTGVGRAGLPDAEVAAREVLREHLRAINAGELLDSANVPA